MAPSLKFVDACGRIKYPVCLPRDPFPRLFAGNVKRGFMKGQIQRPSGATSPPSRSSAISATLPKIARGAAELSRPTRKPGCARSSLVWRTCGVPFAIRGIELWKVPRGTVVVHQRRRVRWLSPGRLRVRCIVSDHAPQGHEGVLHLHVPKLVVPAFTENGPRRPNPGGEFNCLCWPRVLGIAPLPYDVVIGCGCPCSWPLYGASGSGSRIGRPFLSTFLTLL